MIITCLLESRSSIYQLALSARDNSIVIAIPFV